MIPKELSHEYYFKDISSCPIKKAFENIEYVWETLKKKDELIKIEKSKIEGEVSKNTVIRGSVIIGKNTKIDDFVVIEGPVIIGSNCTIRPSALIRSGTVIGNNCVIGNHAEIKNSIIFDFAKLQSGCFVGDSIIGKGARVASGVILANRRFDQKPVTIKFKDKKYETGIEKFGCILGDYSRLGANVVTSPGTLIGSHVWVYSSTSVYGFIKEKSLVKLKQDLEIVEKEEHDLEFKDREGKI